MVSDVYEFKIWAEGEARDAEGRLLDAEGNPVEPEPDATEKDDDQPLVGEESGPK